MRTNQEVVFDLWCRLTGHDAADLDDDERAAFFAEPQVDELSILPYPDLLNAAITAAYRGSLPLQRWLADVPTPAPWQGSCAGDTDNTDDDLDGSGPISSLRPAQGLGPRHVPARRA